MHWADVMAQRLAERGDRHIVATGITPSGEFHIGHIREILTGDMIARAARHAGLEAELVFVVDNADPLRKVYPFLDASYERFIGHQLGAIPAPKADGTPDWERFNNEGWTYGDHFLAPFLDALAQLGVRPRLLPNLEAYRRGAFAPYAKTACDQPERVREIIERISGRELPESWFPWQPLNDNGSLDGVTVTGYDYPLVHFTAADGTTGTSDITKGEGKLPWRLDWPAKWGFNEVTCEPFGKDHGAAGGSYATGRELAAMFGHAPPEPLTYEWISLRGQGAMSSSAGNTVGPVEALKLVPPEILRFLVANTKPNKAIEFDTGMGLVKLADEYERFAARDFTQEMAKEGLSRRQKVQIEDAQAALRLSAVNDGDLGTSAVVTFRHLALLAQVKPNDESVLEAAGVSGDPTATTALSDRLNRMRTWVASSHFPEEIKVALVKEPALAALQALEPHQQALVSVLSGTLGETEWTENGITQAMKAAAAGDDVTMRDVYRAAYAMFLGAERGPRLASILANCDRTAMMELTAACSAAMSSG